MIVTLSTIEQAIYNVVRQEGLAPVDPETVIRTLKNRFGRSEILDAVWRLVGSNVLGLSEKRRLFVVER